MNDHQGYDLLFSKKEFNHQLGDRFSTCGVYNLKEVYVIGSGFRLTMPEFFTIRDRENPYYTGPFRRSTDKR